uniref:RNA-binding S4 domain-containing protein n=1 Tax=Anaerococcus mediterraneensis TaxID=1870984 RepID=UPI00093049C4|nr:RNA-binding S4 domain-containing protein [Anaerococcus mediterraneensis]
MEYLEFETPEIKLKDLLKVLNLVETGGMAKAIIQEEGLVVNNEPCFIAGKKLRPGDRVIFDDYEIVII